ncbi:Gfo/Idh/MocA family protein [Rhodanobacter spathiphylli]|uniref:Oxidoreductase n=1 Tax=Rhodanobacter spathiphylli B39 TaxID=1163407 RepID=I4W7E2_9GAMM|nr:Gfo/Idh/MocA family oxidoreductase [Rhodanobacter spathiphylli]EIL95383.1 oxidoreductase [Rhodanobacter spathiphylli B39]
MSIIKNAIGVGVIGASPLNPGWAMAAHIPAIQALPDYELRAISTSRPESARAAAEAFGVPAFTDPVDLITHPDVDLVVVAVKVPHHHALISAALDAGRMVLSEWPLGKNLDEAIDLADRARMVDARTAIGLQARFAPAVRHARTLVTDGYIGEVLGTTLVGSGIAWGGVTDRAHAYMFDATNGASTLSVPTLHALEAVNFVLGDFVSVAASTAVRRSTVQIAEDGLEVPVTTPDQIAISGTLASGAIASIFYRGGVSRGDNLRWEINGTEGDLVITSSVGNLQVADLLLLGGSGKQTTVVGLELPESYAHEPGGLSGDIGANVLRTYAHLAHDIREGSRTVPDFQYALRRHRLLAAIEEASRSGSTQYIREPAVVLP